MKDRFDLEEQITRTGDYASQLRDLAEFMIENDGSYDIDKMHNALVGIAQMLDIHTDKMYNTMCDALELNQKPVATQDVSSVVKKCGGGCCSGSLGLPMD